MNFTAAAAAAKSLQSCPTLCDPIDGSPPGSPIPGILQARTLEWVHFNRIYTISESFFLSFHKGGEQEANFGIAFALFQKEMSAKTGMF